MSSAADDPRTVLEAVAYGHDSRITPGDRVRAIERLAELDLVSSAREQRTEDLSPEQVLTEVESLAAAVPGMLVCARVAAGQDAGIEPPVEEQDVVETLELAVRVTDLQARRIIDLESALQRLTVHRLLPAAPEPVR